ncbi:hypothetical protein NIES4102_41290 (plasmid) [Chondrocystis sp. NIES-4102]|nr:hypothetical protein NIES4102_41290 [Chondrocystis sp. NIES-4102]
MPFFHLKNDNFWHFKFNPGFEYIGFSQSKIKVRTVSALNQAVQYAYLDPELFSLLKNSTSRNELILVLIDSWFSNKSQQIERSLSLDAFANISDELLETGGRVYQKEEIEIADSQTVIVRNGAFRRIVTSIYGYRCAFCGLQVFNNQENIVDGAHIKPFSQFYDDRINNGLSLCKNHHWAFDRFWFTINDDYSILVSDNLHENSPHTTPMKAFHGQRLILPNNSLYHPRTDAIVWHRQIFLEKIA